MDSDYGLVSVTSGDVKNSTIETSSIIGGKAIFKIALASTGSYYGRVEVLFKSNPPTSRALIATVTHRLGYVPANLQYTMTPTDTGARSGYDLQILTAQPLITGSAFSWTVDQEIDEDELRLYITTLSGAVSIIGKTLIIRFSFFAHKLYQPA